MTQVMGNGPARQKKAAPFKHPARSIQRDYFEPNPYDNARGESALWMGVITQAMQDALSNVKNAEAVFHKHEAIRWLTGNSKDFIEVCIMAGADPSYIRQKAKRTLANPAPWRAEPTKGPRYEELKAYKQRRKLEKKSAVARMIPHPAVIAAASVLQSAVIAGVWA